MAYIVGHSKHPAAQRESTQGQCAPWKPDSEHNIAMAYVAVWHGPPLPLSLLFLSLQQGLLVVAASTSELSQ